MKLKAFICDVLAREAYYWASGSQHVIDIELLSSDEHHDYPKKGHDVLQNKIDALDASRNKYDYILLGFGLCGKMLGELKSRNIPMVVPRVHDCIALFLGSNKAYNKHCVDQAGTLCYIDAWLERSPARLEKNELQSIGFNSSFEEYVEKYGEEGAEYLTEIANSWKRTYAQCLYVKNKSVNKDFSAAIKAQAAERNWQYQEVQGNSILIKKLMLGEWCDEEFLIIDSHSIITQDSEPRTRIIRTDKQRKEI